MINLWSFLSSSSIKQCSTELILLILVHFFLNTEEGCSGEIAGCGASDVFGVEKGI